MNSATSDQHQTENGPVESVGYERHDVNVKVIIVFAVICVGILVISLLGVDTYFVYYREKLIKQASTVEPVALNMLRAKDMGILNNYGVIDKEKGIYHIPISEAMGHIVGDYKERMK